ncbi:MAG: cation diffusion facilitator family transporter, partial [Phycisphaerae bacterium]|nr:cation diffusion facilitator family transporter [Phycisphaerae bacterium]
VAINVTLTGAKILVGALCRSQALIADGVHSGSDLASDVPVLAALRVSGKPADRTHHYGHLRVNTLASLVVGAMLAGAAGMIAYEAIQLLHKYVHHHPVPQVQAGWPFWLALASAPIKELLFQVMRYVGRKASNMAVVVNAWHSRADAFAALAAAAGLGGVLVGGSNWRFLDPLTAIVLAAFLLVVSLRIMGEAASELIDRAPAQAVQDNIRRILAETEGVRSFHAFRARQLGGKVEMDVHVQVDPHLTVAAGHAIASRVRRRVQEADASIVQVIVHVEPAE